MNKRGPPIVVSQSEKKRRKQLLNVRRITIGETIDDWLTLRNKLGISNEDLARLLIETYSVHMSTCHSIPTTSTPVPSKSLIPVLPPEVLDMSAASTDERFTMKRAISEHSSNLNGCAEKKMKLSRFWSLGLTSALKDTSKHIQSDEHVVVIKDLYPKARHHFLILPRKIIPSLFSLSKDDLTLLQHIEDIGWKIASKNGSVKDFRVGYHAIPSMSHLHMHVISQDFDSPYLKTKKHWNSFTSEYFINSADVIKKLEDTGKFSTDKSQTEDLLKRPLMCHVCQSPMKTIPQLKTHIKTHDLIHNS